MRKRAEELIRKLVPELQELKVGCVVHFKNLPNQSIIVNESELYDSFGLFNADYPTVESYIRNDIITYCDILGSEIHLKHVLLAIENTNRCVSEFYAQQPIIVVVWNFYDPNKPFTEQSEEFYNFIIKTLAD